MTPLIVRPIYSSSKLRTAQMMIFSLVAMIGLEKCCITSAYVTQVSEPWPVGLLLSFELSLAFVWHGLDFLLLAAY